MRECRPLVTDHIAGMDIASRIHQCRSHRLRQHKTRPYCTLVQFALDDGAAGRTLPVEQAKFDY
jgi:hypothetical protein